MTNLGERHGVKRRPSTTPEGDHVVATKYTVNHRKYFAVVKHHSKDGSTYSIRKLKKGGGFAKTTPTGLTERIFNTEGDAKRGLWVWDCYHLT